MTLTDTADPFEPAARVKAKRAESKLKSSTVRGMLSKALCYDNSVRKQGFKVADWAIADAPCTGSHIHGVGATVGSSAQGEAARQRDVMSVCKIKPPRWRRRGRTKAERVGPTRSW